MVDGVSSATSAGDSSRRSMQMATHLVNRIGVPGDIAELVCYLASDEASFVNGAVWLIDGGALAWRGTADQLT
jgi:NAD(P)-dependent dehydrogenase (short-subunit alcohol dehydrogenase family)